MENICYQVDAHGIAVITWDMPGRSMNVLQIDANRQFAEAVERALADPSVRGAIVTSGKDSFIAGADLNWIEQVAASKDDRATLARRVFDDVMAAQLVFRRIETGGKPFVAAINGTALGGGFELCLACHHRIAADLPRSQLGLPEAKVGVFPGGGGTQRYIRMLGALEALPLLVEGRTMAPAEALRLRLVDHVVPLSDLIAAARAWILAAGPESAQKPWDRKGFQVPGTSPRTPEGAMAFTGVLAAHHRRTFGNYPNLDHLMQAVYEGMLVDMDAAVRIEARHFTATLLAPRTRNVVRTQFVSMQRAAKLPHRPTGVAKQVLSKIGVIGAGMMGRGIAHVALQAGVEVVLIDRSQEAAEAGRKHLADQYAEQVSKKRISAEQAEGAMSRLLATDDFASLKGAQLVIEAVFEDRKVKADVTGRAAMHMRADAVFASNTSTLPITGLAEAFPDPSRFIGLHFFSPVERMPLVEIIRGKKTGDLALAVAMDFVQKIRKTSILVNDSRGFYTSRVFGTYTNEAHEMVCEGVNPALIENAGKMAGMPMAPLALTDEVSLELIYSVLVQTARDLGKPHPSTNQEKLIARMVEKEGRPGRKGGQGFYDYPAAGPKRLWSGLRAIAAPAEHQPEVAELRTRFLTIQALEAARCFFEGVVTDPADADIGALLGWGFAPWSGGPLSYIEMTGVARFVETCDVLAKRHGSRFEPGESLRKMAERGSVFYSR